MSERKEKGGGGGDAMKNWLGKWRKACCCCSGLLVSVSGGAGGFFLRISFSPAHTPEPNVAGEKICICETVFLLGEKKNPEFSNKDELLFFWSHLPLSGYFIAAPTTSGGQPRPFSLKGHP